jgi:hypothetical protein
LSRSKPPRIVVPIEEEEEEEEVGFIIKKYAGKSLHNGS